MKAGYPIDEPIQAYGGQTPLMFAASVGQSECIEKLFTYGPDLAAQDVVGRTVLHYCCRGGNIDNLRTLLAKVQKEMP